MGLALIIGIHRTLRLATAFFVVASPAIAQRVDASVIGREIRTRRSDTATWQRGIAEFVADSGLTLRQGATTRFLSRDSILILERRDGKDRGALAQIVGVGFALGIVVGEQVGRRSRRDVAGAVGGAYGTIIGGAIGATAGTLLAIRFAPERWEPIDVALVFRR